MKKKTSLNDIAKKLGVSKTLVSMVLNNHGDEKGISKVTQKKVWKVAEQLNYKPNLVARGLRLGSSKTIGLIVADISNIFFSTIARSVEDSAGKRGYNVMYMSSDENEQKEIDLINILKERQVDGLILATALKNRDEIVRLKQEHFPFVLIDRYCPNLKTNFVIVDNRLGAFSMTEHLIKCKHHKIGLLRISPSHISPIVDRVRGYKNSLKKHGIRVDKRLIREIPYGKIKQTIETELKKLLRPPLRVEAIFFLNNMLAIAGIEVLHKMGLRIPQDVAVVSFDDIELFQYSYPTITSVAQPVEEIGKKAVEILQEEIDQGGRMKLKKQIILPTELVLRRSCGCFLNVF